MNAQTVSLGPNLERHRGHPQRSARQPMHSLSGLRRPSGYVAAGEAAVSAAHGWSGMPLQACRMAQQLACRTGLSQSG
jgi:hypothetical protein